LNTQVRLFLSFTWRLHHSTIDKLAFSRKNTRKNPDDKKTTPVSDPKRLLKPNGYLKSTTTFLGKIYQPKIALVNTKVPVEELTPEDNFKQASSTKASTSKPEVRFENLEEIVPKIKYEIDSTDTPNGQNERSLSISTVVNILSTSSLPEVKVLVL
jgi:hypothetical protein